MDFEDFLLAATKTKPILEPTTFPTVVPDPPIFQHIGGTGHRTLWVVFVLMLVAFLAFSALSWTVPASRRLLHSLTSVIVLIATLSYLAMATGSGWVWHHSRIRHTHEHGIPDTFTHVHRQVHWVRYLDWLLTTPLLVVDLALLAGVNGANIFSLVVADLVMIIGGLVGALSWNTKVKWGWFVIAFFGYLWIMYVFVMGIATARTRGGAVLSRFYTSIMAYTLIVWLAYPVIWAVASSGRRLSVDGEVLAYGILDVLTKGVFGAWLLLAHHRITETNVVVEGFWAHGAQTEGLIRVGDDEEGA